MLNIDSLSRNSYNRNFPKTIEYLSKSLPEGVKAYDFEAHNIQGDNSLGNNTPLFTGKRLSSVNWEAPSKDWQSTAIWKYLRKWGFATMLGAESSECLF